MGGTVGDLESSIFLESFRQLKLEFPKRTAFVHVTLIPYSRAVGQQKSKPTQHSVKMLQSMGSTFKYGSILTTDTLKPRN
ncbi:unnamed protein product [marine sediment metagenome]|uniref:CTP synthase N-terminal domain-containing protein n=1 Tax=marine sediment metagenome TaxID=412755 RepID=X1C4Z3_9ZZZZ